MVDQQSDAPAPWVPVRATGTEVSDLSDGLVVYDPASHTAHHLNAVAALVWEAIDGVRTAHEIAEVVAKVLEIEPELARGYADDGLEQLAARGVIS